MQIIEISPKVKAYLFKTLSSTMDEAKRMVLQNQGDGSVVVAESQTHGRGRRGRLWQSPPGNLYATYIAYPKLPINRLGELSFVVCIAIGEALKMVMKEKEASLLYKWPNDILLNNKKVGGVLLEVLHPDPVNRADYFDGAILIGLGINLVSSPKPVLYPATSFAEEKIEINYLDVLKSICIKIQEKLDLWRKSGFLSIRNTWLKQASRLGEQICINYHGKETEGLFKGIDEEGALLLQTTEKNLLRVPAGDVLF